MKKLKVKKVYVPKRDSQGRVYIDSSHPSPEVRKCLRGMADDLFLVSRGLWTGSKPTARG